jgi:hypothetical protein
LCTFVHILVYYLNNTKEKLEIEIGSCVIYDQLELVMDFTKILIES